MVNNVINVFSLIVTDCFLVCANIVILMIFQFPDIGFPDGFGRSQTKMKGGTGPDGGCADSRPWAFTAA